mmetsp:Transcript_26583/g.61513  ORF Transcript_26583/g.61513 Transcript_26583/m.61513 type:complete len:201 (-) Transcript_26583:155-757(-)
MGRGKGSKVRISMGGSTTFQVTLNGGKQRGGGQSVPSGGLMSSSMKKAMGIAKGAGAKGSMGGRLGIVKKQPGMGGDLRSRLGGGRGQQMQQMTFVANNMPQQQQQQQSRADAEDSWGHDMFYKSGQAQMESEVEPAPASFLRNEGKATGSRLDRMALQSSARRAPVSAAKRATGGGSAAASGGSGATVKKGRGSFTFSG